MYIFNFYLYVALLCIWCLIGDTECIIPQPIITLHDGHIGLYDGLMETQYTGTVTAGRPYTLDIYMGNTDQYDYVIDQCTYNHRQTFIDQFGCLQNNNIFLQKWETDQYTNAGAIKRTLVHLVAEESVLYFECQIKVLECCGCAEQSCERRPSISQYPIYPVPLTCCGNIPPPIIPPPPPPPAIFPRHIDWFGLLPWWLWLIFLLIFTFLCCLLCCLLACCLARNRGKVHANKAVLPIQQQPPPIFRADKVAQTVPEHRQISQQTSLDNYNFNNKYKECNHLQFDDHASISLNDQRQSHDRRATASQEYGKRRGNERAYSGQSTNFVHPFYSSPYLDRREHWEEQVEEFNESVIDTTTHYAIVRLYQEGKRVMEISRLLNIPQPTVSKAIKRFEETGSNEDRSRSGRPVTATTEENIQAMPQCTAPHNSIPQLKESLVREWDAIPQSYIQNAIDSFPKRLRKCIAANGGHFVE